MDHFRLPNVVDSGSDSEDEDGRFDKTPREIGSPLLEAEEDAIEEEENENYEEEEEEEDEVDVEGEEEEEDGDEEEEEEDEEGEADMEEEDGEEMEEEVEEEQEEYVNEEDEEEQENEDEDNEAECDPEEDVDESKYEEQEENEDDENGGRSHSQSSEILDETELSAIGSAKGEESRSLKEKSGLEKESIESRKARSKSAPTPRQFCHGCISVTDGTSPLGVVSSLEGNPNSPPSRHSGVGKEATASDQDGLGLKDFTRADKESLISEFGETQRKEIESRRRRSVGYVATPWTPEQVLNMVQYKEVVEYEDEWKLITMPTEGTLWINSSAQLFRRYPPNCVIIRQQNELNQRDIEQEQHAVTVRELQQSKEDIELLKSQFVDREEEHRLEVEELTEMLARSRAITLQHERDVVLLKGEVAYLQATAYDVETMDQRIIAINIELETLEKRCDKKCQKMLERVHEAEDTKFQLQKAQELLETLKVQNEDMKYQFMNEVVKNGKLEKRLMDYNEMKDKTLKAQDDSEARKRDVEDKVKLLTAAKKSIREFREQIRELERDRKELQETKEELRITQYENDTLKQLLGGKDALVMKKTQALDIARTLIDNLRAKDENYARDIDSMLGKRNFFNYKSSETAESSCSPSIPSCPSVTPVSSIYSGDDRVSSGASREGFIRNRHRHSPTMLDILNTRPTFSSSLTCVDGFHDVSWRYPFDRSSDISCPPEMNRETPLRAQTAVVRPMNRYGPLQSALNSGPCPTVKTPRIETRLQVLHRTTGLPKNEIDRVASLFVHIGDRIQVQVPASNASKPHQATVKYIGTLDKGPHSRKVYVGVKLDAAVGDTDGTFKLVRYFSVAQNKGKILRVSQIHTVYNVKSGSYLPLEDWIKNYVKNKR